MDEDRNDDGHSRRHSRDDKIQHGSGSKKSHSAEKKRSQDLYSVKVQKVSDDRAPKRLIFDLVEGIPKGSSSHHVNKIETSTQVSDDPHESHHEVRDIYPEIPEKIDVYYFDHGNSAYYQTTDKPPPIMAELLIEKSDLCATRIWAEIFGSAHICVAFFTTFILQLTRFILYSLLRPLTVGMIQLISDYFLKPLLTILFNSIIQPFLILLYNIATSIRDVCEPLAQAFGFWMSRLSILFHSIRLVEVNHTTCHNCHQRNVPQDV